MADLNFVAFTFVFMIPTFYFLAVHRCTAGNPERGYAEMWELFPTKGDQRRKSRWFLSSGRQSSFCLLGREGLPSYLLLLGRVGELARIRSATPEALGISPTDEAPVSGEVALSDWAWL